MKVPLEERLLEAAEKGLKIRVPIKELIIDNVRDWPEEKVKALRASIAEVGLLVLPIINTKAIVFDGAGRVLTGIDLGWSEIDATVIKTDLTASEWKIRQLTTSIHREKLTDWQLYENCMTLLNLRTDWKQVDLAKHLAVDEPTISRWMSPSKNTVKGREALKAGLIGFTETTRLGRLPEEEKDTVLASILDGTTRTRDELDLVVRERTKKPSKNGHKPDVNRFNGPLPSGNRASFVGPMACVSDLRDAAREMAKLADKAIREGVESIKAFEMWLKAKDKGES